MLELILTILGVLAGVALFLWLVFKSTDAEMKGIESDDPEVQDRAWDHW